MPVTIEDKDLGFTRMVLNFRELQGRSVKIGLWGDEVVDYAMYNEFGTSRIPPRPFMATTYDQNVNKVTQFTEHLVGSIIDGKATVDHTLQVLGEYYQKLIQITIRNAKDWAVPNDPKTVERKGSSSPLIDTGRMINSIRYEVS